MAKNHDKIPQHIYYFRAGVSDGNYAKLEAEVSAIKAAASALAGGNSSCPEVTLIVAEKRFNFRPFPPTYRAKDYVNNSGEIIPSRIRDNDILLASYSDSREQKPETGEKKKGSIKPSDPTYYFVVRNGSPKNDAGSNGEVNGSVPMLQTLVSQHIEVHFPTHFNQT